MAHFAELNSANEVLRVTVVENKDTADATWIAPSAMPTDGGMYNWDEDNQTWINLSGASAGG